MSSQVAGDRPGTVELHSSAGTLRGIGVDTPNGAVERFAGIPFGEAAVGGSRFRAPVPARPWEGILDATRFGPSPAQAMSGPFSAAVPGMTVERIDEDCLTVNIWRPANVAPDALLQVMVWVYGGAFVIGGGALSTYDGARLAAEQNVVVVTINYRVGPFGFLDLRATPGGDAADTNCGLRDQLLALTWVRQHVASFGGDPQRITVFGESAGAGSIIHLLTTPDIGQLIHGAIAQSPGIDFTQTAEQSQRVTEAFLAATGATSVDDLRVLPTAALIDAQQAVSAHLLFDLGTMVFHPVVDDDLIRAKPSVALAGGAAADVALLIGYATEELRLFPDPRANGMDDAGLTRWTHQYLTTRLGSDPGEDVAARLVHHYRDAAAGTARSRGADVWSAIQTDGVMRQPVIRVADARRDAPTYVYQFAWQARRANDDPGAFHAIDLPFTFDTFDAGSGDSGTWAEFVGIDETGRAIGHRLRSAWAAFAASGDPSCALGAWPRYDAESRQTMVFGDAVSVAADPLATERSWWEGLWSPACRPAGVPR